jgi:hypothetical protein
LPPTSTQGNGASAYTTTFKFNYPNTAITYSGTTATFGITNVAGGGTGLGTLTANNVILGNGTGNVLFVAPGASGNVLTSNGTTWTSAAPSSSGTPKFANVTGNAGATTSGNPIIFPTETDDDDNIYDTSTGRVTVPTGKTFCIIRWYTTGDNVNRILSCYKNGTKVTDGSNNDTNGAGIQNGTCYIKVVATDLIDIRPNNTMTGNANSNAGFACW